MNTNMSRERQEAVWAPAKQVAISRMEFMRLSALSGAAAALAATIPSTRIAEA